MFYDGGYKYLFPIWIQVALSFLTALQSDERSNYQLDVKFQESYLKKIVVLLQCQLSEGAVADKDIEGADADSTEVHCADEMEEGELADSHGEFCCISTFYTFQLSKYWVRDRFNSSYVVGVETGRERVG